MIRSGIDFALTARPHKVAGTKLLIAKKRAAAMDPLLLIRLSRIKWRVRSLRIARDSAFVGQRRVIVRAVPIAAPFPHVSGHIVKTVAIWRKGFHRGDSGVTVLPRIFHRKFSLPGVGHPFSAWTKFVAPHICLS